MGGAAGGGSVEAATGAVGAGFADTTGGGLGAGGGGGAEAAASDALLVSCDVAAGGGGVGVGSFAAAGGAAGSGARLASYCALARSATSALAIWLRVAASFGGTVVGASPRLRYGASAFGGGGRSWAIGPPSRPDATSSRD